MTRIHQITGHGGVRLHVRDEGPENAPPILLIHGWSQHHLSWSKQLGGALAQDFRLIAPDLRGHGGSEKPDAPEAYNQSEPWAGDIAAIIKALKLKKPVLTGWSMGGWVACDYLRVHGEAKIGGLVLIGSPVVVTPALAGTRRPEAKAEGMYAEDQAEQIAAAIEFVKACAASPLSKRDLAFMVGFNMLVPPHVRKAARLREVDFRPDLAKLTRPALVIQGAAERVCTPAMFEAVKAAMPRAEVAVIPGTGHAPFWEAPEKFDAILAGFAKRAQA